MSIVFQDTNKVIDLTDVLNALDNSYKTKVNNLLQRFDFESTADKSKCKHYPLDMESGVSAEETNTALELMSKAMYSTLLSQLQGAYINKGHITVEPKEFDERSTMHKVKIGKVWATPPNRFSTVNTVLTQVQPFAYAYRQGDKYELMGEINFGIEIY